MYTYVYTYMYTHMLRKLMEKIQKTAFINICMNTKRDLQEYTKRDQIHELPKETD